MLKHLKQLNLPRLVKIHK